MQEELETTPEVETPPVENRNEKRIKQLDQEANKAKQEAQEAKQEAENARKEAGFYKDFTTQLSKYPHAAEFQEKIREKVMKGYDVGDATAAVLVSEGKFGPQAPKVENPAGGSAINTQAAPKSFREMSQIDKLAELRQREKAGDISWQ